MIVRDGETISYNPERFSEAINLARNANANASSIKQATTKLKSVSTPSKPSIGTNISANASQIETYIESMSNVEGTLIAMKNAAENTVNEGNALFKDAKVEIVGEFKRIKIKQNGVEGYLYFPKDRDSLEGLPLLVCIGGAAMGNKTKPSKMTLLMKNGYSLDSAVFIPLTTNPARLKTSKLVSVIENIVDVGGIDKKRVSIYGHSEGGLKAYQLVAERPNYFSSCTVYSATLNKNQSLLTKELAEKIAQSNETVIMTYMNTTDFRYTKLNEYKKLINAGVTNIV